MVTEMKSEFDPDSSPKAWEMYKKNYKNFKFMKEPILSNNRLIAQVTVKNAEFKVGGDCSFNFNDIKRISFEDIINSGKIPFEKQQQLLKQLEKCCEMHHSLYNFDLIPVSGGLNNLKGKLKYVNENGEEIVKFHGVGKNPKNGLLDRLDTFIYFLDLSFKSIEFIKQSKTLDLKKIGEFYNNSIFTYSMKTNNFSVLYETIECFPNIYEYCITFYNLNDRNIVDRLIENGRKSITDVEDVEKYMNLAQDFWQIKKQFIQ